MSQFLGLRTAIYTAKHLAAAKDWYTAVLGFGPYFDEPYYVGFNIKGYELGIVPDESAEITRSGAGIAYWGVPNADAAWGRLLELGAAPYEPLEDHGVRIGAVRDPFGNILGVIEHPAFKAESD